MKYMEYTKFDKPIMALLLVPYTLATCYAIYGSPFFDFGRIFWFGTATVLAFLFVQFQVMKTIALALRKKYPNNDRMLFRIFIELSIFIPFTAAMMVGFYGLLSYYHYLGSEWQIPNVRWLIIVGVIGNILATTLNEGAYTFEMWKNAMVETEELKKANLQSRLESLKNQVNPHFLFNALNSLSSLINESPDEAEKFLDEMTKVYRYLLRNNEQELTALNTEIKFLNSYFHLLKTRYGDGINMQLAILPDYDAYLVPPLTLQLLVENAVKHNVILREKPLHISVETIPGGQLMVRNSLQLKTVHVSSNKVGLRNISDKYKLMNQPDIMVAQTESFFSVTIPLIRPAETLNALAHEAV